MLLTLTVPEVKKFLRDGESPVFPATEEITNDDEVLQGDISYPGNIEENFNVTPRKIPNTKISKLIDNYILPENSELRTSDFRHVNLKTPHEENNDYIGQQKNFHIHRRHKKLKRKTKSKNNYLTKTKHKELRDLGKFLLNSNFTKKGIPSFRIERNKRNQKYIIHYEDPSRYLFNWREVLLLIGISILFSSSVVCCCASIFQSGVCEKKSAAKCDFKVDKWWANQNTPEALLLLPGKKSLSREKAICKWSQSSEQKNKSKVICQCSSNSSASIAF
ncbi:uncharacterized protein TNIN_4691 [Trichonephila inaurata madagascariensis]|uniref:Uncharacterized protein n=1 Tax=Trichonephila inaurata madagascariensis TaxID=2747483 RepID=A0A8X7CNA1_9ARAC|nr:uncharacterized protein TNIN_4691 [Trichonephila inaurata madagascariensis]